MSVCTVCMGVGCPECDFGGEQLNEVPDEEYQDNLDQDYEGINDEH